ncbi:hypothetical protein PVAP13_8KG332001 [Panicum virgatum]|uniref:Uncharacterized protein n=1 Tax=Panicum virgatum TaxID=38727 RepID=A0A8T0PKN7_PANVG|nr:hypothetical protein PVAP13_8KG332001 [Panicum virgatum]
MSRLPEYQRVHELGSPPHVQAGHLPVPFFLARRVPSPPTEPSLRRRVPVLGPSRDLIITLVVALALSCLCRVCGLRTSAFCPRMRTHLAVVFCLDLDVLDPFRSFPRHDKLADHQTAALVSQVSAGTHTLESHRPLSCVCVPEPNLALPRGRRAMPFGHAHDPAFNLAAAQPSSVAAFATRI